MKKNIVTIVVALCLVIAGVALAGAALVAVDFRFGEFSSADYERNSYVIEGDIGEIGISAGDYNVTLLPSSDGICRIEVDESEKFKLRYHFEEDHLEIKIVDNRKWYDYIGIFSTEADIVLYLPAEEYEILSVATRTGDVKVSEDFSFGIAAVAASTGDINFSAKVSVDLSLSCVTGDISVCDIEPENLSASVTTGNIVLENIKASDTISLSCNTGRIEVHGSEAGDIESEGTTGDILLKYVTVEGQVKIERSTGDVTLTSVVAGSFDILTDTGDVKLNLSDAEEINIETDTGRVEGSLLTPKTFWAESDTGRVRVPQSSGDGVCKIKTDTGNISITIE